MTAATRLREVEVRTIGEHRGAKRIWIDGSQAVRGGFFPGVQYVRDANPEKYLLVLKVAEKGTHIVSRKVKGDHEIPVIDLNSNDLLKMFEGLDTVRVVIQPGRISILPLASALRAKERLARLFDKITRGTALSIGGLTSGIGVLDRAAHEGLSAAGIKSKLSFANEIRKDCQEYAIEYNPVHEADTIHLTMPIQELAFDEWVMSQLPQVDGLVIGICCSGASIAGRSKRKLTLPEDHPEVGHLVVPFLSIAARLSPIWIAIECVPGWLNTASASLARSMFRDLGYDVHETILNAADWNMLEHRERMCMVAVTKGIQFDFELEKPAPVTRTFGEIMDDVDPNDSTYGAIDYIWSKLKRDQAAGKGFGTTVVDRNSTKLPTLNKTLHKRQSTGTYIQHPTNPNLYRIPTVPEHWAAKGIWKDMLGKVTQQFGHETAGQAISTPPFVSVFKRLGQSLIDFVQQGTVAFPGHTEEVKVAA